MAATATPIFASATDVAQPGDDLLQVTVDYITANSPVDPVVEGRIGRSSVTQRLDWEARAGPIGAGLSHRVSSTGAAARAIASAVTPDLQATLAKLPDRPGVYLMRDARGEVVYVGKAQSLRHRVRSYWQKAATGPLEGHRIRAVIDKITDVEYTITDSVSEALLLEANLIKRYRPRFNVRLKDDKSYPYIKITMADDFPRVERTRKLVDDGSRYFGPYASASSVDESMNLVRRLFPFRTCTIDIKDGERALQRPCLLYHIKRCQGPCIQAVSKPDYRAQIDQIELFLEGRQETVVRALSAEMREASERTDYEQAAALRDKVRAIERTMESQKMAAFRRTAARPRGTRPAGQPGGDPAVRDQERVAAGP